MKNNNLIIIFTLLILIYPLLTCKNKKFIETKIESNWQGYKVEKYTLKAIDNSDIPVVIYYPKNITENIPCVLALHGLSGNKDDWCEIDGFTKGGNVTLKLLENGFALVCFDYRMHGERLKDQSLKKDLFNELRKRWNEIYYPTYDDLLIVFDYIKNIKIFDTERIGIIGYSMGGLYSFALSAEKGKQIKSVIACVPPIPSDDFIWQGAPQENVDKIEDISFLMIVGTKDENSKIADSEKIFDKINSKNKKLIKFNSGHSLPEEYKNDVLKWFKETL